VASGGASGSAAGEDPSDGDVLESFQTAGRTLFSLGLVRGTEGNLSSFDGRTLWITRPEAPLNELTGEHLVSGRLEGSFSDASSDVDVLRSAYRERGPGAVVHAHPPGTVPAGLAAPGEHGIYVFGPTLPEAAEDAVRQARAIEGLDR
jgi:ribulose-5-phosphate 4-epimerase/fuculose-1-phosphate aldolase